MMMSKKKLLAIVFASLISLTISATAFAALDEAAAKEIAEKWVPKGASHLLTKIDQHEYEVVFITRNNVKYKVEINKLTEKVTKVKTKLQNSHGSAIISLTADDVSKIVISEFPDATIHRINLELEDGYQQYEVKFSTDTVRGEMEINPETGVVIERELHY